MKKEYIGKTKNGFEVYVDRDSSHAVTHFTDTPILLHLVKKFIPEFEMEGERKSVEFDAGEIIGFSDLVETGDTDEIVYALRPHRSLYSRFVKNKKPVPTSVLTIVLIQTEGKICHLYTAYLGPLTPSFPGGDYLPEQSKQFWSKHALAWGTQQIIPGTETNVCPW